MDEKAVTNTKVTEKQAPATQCDGISHYQVVGNKTTYIGKCICPGKTSTEKTPICYPGD